MRAITATAAAITLTLACGLPLAARADAQADQSHPPAPLARMPTLAAMRIEGASAKAPEQFATNCMGCHGGDGQGISGKIPPLREMVLFTRSPAGRAFLVSVPGASNSALSDADLAGVLNWMLAYFSPADSAVTWQPYTAQEVTAHRRPALSEVKATRAALVRRLAQDGPAPTEQY